ncbi:hypothetical protein BDN72DRAFT_542903 [Pluteus cervinus]|uniref:Uncharacterized protein n=1 Tax=Pluteus cervinus TaxID=181527 RepID=A0ACD3AXE4_9AGAR|nr:hypothetical protein BDN72DRAFT_542903 [Pluteus cervinus]
MKIVTTFHQPSSVLDSVKCSLSTHDLDHLVVAKLNRVDVYSLQPHGTQYECGLDIWGKVVCVKAIPISGTTRSNLLLLLAHPDPELIFLSYVDPSGDQPRLVVKKQLPLFERIPRAAEFYNNVLMHPSGRLAVVSCYTGKLKIVHLKGGNHVKDFDVSQPELNVLSLTFLPAPEDQYVLGILHLDHQERLQLLARDILVDELELSTTPSAALQPTVISSKAFSMPTDFVPMLIPVEPPANPEEEYFLGGVLVIGGRKIFLYELSSPEGQEKQQGKRRRLELRKKSGDAEEATKAREKERERESRKRRARCSVDWPWGEVTAWCAVDSKRFILGDAFGRFSMLAFDKLHETGLMIIPLGESSAPTTLTYLSSQAIYLGSHVGDSKILQISPTPSSLFTTPTLHVPSEISTVHPDQLMKQADKKGKAPAIDDDVDMESGDPSKGSVLRTTGSFLNTITTFKNIAPILDATLVDIDGSGQKQLVTCSGGRNTGSLNVIRNGADFKELAVIPGLSDVVNIWTLRKYHDDKEDRHLVASTLQSTMVFRINDNGGTPTFTHITHFNGNGPVTNQPTLACANIKRRTTTNGRSTYVDSSLIVQVTPVNVYILDWDETLGEYNQVSAWNVINGQPSTVPTRNEIVAASLSASQVLIATSASRLKILRLGDGHAEEAHDIAGREISAVSCLPLDPSKPFSRSMPVAYWGTNVVEVVQPSHTTFSSLSKSQPLPALVRSLLLVNFGADANSKSEDHQTYLLAGLGDGSLVSFLWKDSQLTDRKIVSLGHTPVSLTRCTVEGKTAVFAVGNRAMIVSWDRRRLRYSSIMLKDIVASTNINTRTFESALVIATSQGLHIGRVQEVDKMHIRTIPLGLDNPRRIAYEPTLKTFGVACSHAQPGRLGEPELSSASFKLFDDTTFTELSQFICEIDEDITAVTIFSPTINGKATPLFCLGTYIYQAEEKEPTQGRLLVLSAHASPTPTRLSSHDLTLVTSQNVHGCVYALTVVDSLIVAAVNSAVKLFRLTNVEDSPASKLEPLGEWNHNYIVSSLASFGDSVVLGDQISSVSLLKVQGDKFQNVARDYGPRWPVSVEALDDKNIIAANDAYNLITFTLVPLQNTNRSVLERNGEYHLADLVTKFIRGSLLSSDMSNDGVFEPKQLFFTSSGRIGVIIDVGNEQTALHLTALQRNLSTVVEGVGGVSHARFRAPKTTHGRSDADAASIGFLDGDYLEQFLGILGSPQDVAKVVSGRSEPERITTPSEDLQQLLERLQNMH